MGVSPSGTLRVRPASLLTAEEREWFSVHVSAALAHLETVPNSNTTLPGNERWDRRVAAKLMYDADTLIEQLGVDGHHPAIVSAAAMVGSASDTRDMETLRFAVSEFEVVVRRVALERLSANGAERYATEAGRTRGLSVTRLTHRLSMEPDEGARF